ncbi:MAG: Crp/Fnr family transcriptional regulator [Chloroflexota bacterium]
MVPVEMLADTPMFKGLPKSHLEEIAEISHKVQYGQGETIFLEGQRADTLYVLLEGKIALDMKINLGPNHQPKPTTIDILSPGDSFGWSALVEPHVLTSSARTIKASSVIAVDGVGLREFMAEDCSLGFVILQRLSVVISRRLREAREQMVGERGLALIYESLRDSC